MPYVNIKLINDGISADKKAEVIAGVTDVLSRVLDKNPAMTMVVIDEVEADNWGVAGQSVTQRRAEKD